MVCDDSPSTATTPETKCQVPLAYVKSGFVDSPSYVQHNTTGEMAG